MRIILIANYVPDAQQSMIRYAEMLQRILSKCNYSVVVVHPPPILGRLPFAKGSLAKWVRYVDKFIFAPLYLRLRIRTADVVHVCDHSNAMYLTWIGKKPHVVTCHDLLAVLSARGGYEGVRIGASGRLLQKWIASSLIRAKRVVCVSSKTREDLTALSPAMESRSLVIYHSLNRQYSPAPRSEISETLVSLGLEPETKYILHVGGNQWYKNRPMVMQIFAELIKSPGLRNAKLIMAGKPWPAELRMLCSSIGLVQHVVEAANISDDGLRCLYSGALALLFPSREEGFGWPIIEAQACGCPVITTNRAPMTEVAGEAAIFIDPTQPELAAAKILHEWPRLESLRIAGYENVSRFSGEITANAYCSLYREIAGEMQRELRQVNQ